MTHADMKRYFMTIPEATQLVLQAAALGKGGEVFILDMGAPVSVLALAEDMIRLSGFEPGEDIEIRITEIRPGEKLFEELATDEERAEKTSHNKVFVGRVRGALGWVELGRGIEELRCPNRKRCPFGSMTSQRSRRTSASSKTSSSLSSMSAAASAASPG